MKISMNDSGRECLGILLVLLSLGCLSCGYHVRGSGGKLPEGIHSLGIPTFKNLTDHYKVEQILTGAVLKEFSLRANVPVNSDKSGVDAVLLGDVRNVSATAVTFGTQKIGSQTYGSTFLITVQISAKLMRLKDSSVIWQNDDFLYRESYVLNTNIRDFFSEENPALERLARSFAASLASTVLERKTP